MNWYTIMIKEARGNPGAPLYKTRVWNQYVAPLMGDLSAFVPRRIQRLREVDPKANPAISIKKDRFLASLEAIYKAEQANDQGRVRSLSQESAALAKNLLDMKHESPVRSGNVGYTRRVMRAQDCYESFVRPHMPRPMDYSHFAAALKRNNFGSAVGECNKLITIMKGDVTGTQAMVLQGQRVAEALKNSDVNLTGRAIPSRQQAFDVVRYAIPSMTFQNYVVLTTIYKTDAPYMVAWKNENRRLRDEALASPPYTMPDGKPSAAFWKLINSLRNRPSRPAASPTKIDTRAVQQAKGSWIAPPPTHSDAAVPLLA